MANANSTEETLRTAARELAKAVIKIRAIDPELARILERKLTATIQAYREAKRADVWAVEDEARMLAAEAA